jgi:predicted nuclease of predicted toxin-antitoxin system
MQPGLRKNAKLPFLAHEDIVRHEPDTLWAQYLQPSGFAPLVTDWSSDTADEEIMAYAAKEGFVVLTHDLEFSAILAATKGNKPSVVQIRARNITSEALGVTIISALRHASVQLDAGALLDH